MFDGPPSELTEDVLTRIYGAEDWTTIRTTTHEHDQDHDEREAVERMAGLS